ncbi:hypothetical protein G9A89_013491 [Geosiphon pyriformis]|nr:hypothetical protein G9A89_013491 [Geosiphon pyriformis]
MKSSSLTTTRVESMSPPPSPPTRTVSSQHRNPSHLDIDRGYRPELKFTNFAAQAPIVSKYVTSRFLRHDISFFQREEVIKSLKNKEKNEAEDEDDEEDEESSDEEAVKSDHEASKVLVIHPGSKTLRIGRASDAFPFIIPHVITRRFKEFNESRMNEIKNNQDEMDIDREGHQTDMADRESDDTKKEEDRADVEAKKEEFLETNNSASPSSSTLAEENEQEEEETRFKRGIDEIKKELKDRMKAAKRRPVPNAHSQVLSFNKTIQPETIPDHNDPYKVEWTTLTEGKDHYIGDKALRLPISNIPFKIFYPIQHGDFNTRDYDSIKAVVGDLETIWTDAIEEQLKIGRKNFQKYSVILVMPDLFNRRTVLEIITMLLQYMGFRRVFVQQESVCVTFGAGISMACVVDVGAQTTSITCVEDGMCIPDSRILLNYGSDDITTFFLKLLRRSKFPYEEIDLNQSYDWMLAEEMKEKFCTLNEANLTIQLYDFYVRLPNEPTKKYQLKTYDEAIVAPMVLFYPHIINFRKKMGEFPAKFVSYAIDDINDGNASNLLPPAPLSQKPKPSIITNPSQIRPSSHPSPSAGNRDSPHPSTPARSESNNPTLGPSSPSASLVAKTNVDPISMLALDEAIVQSISSSSTEERAKKFYSSIIVVGGGGLLPGFNSMLEDRLTSRSLPFADKLEVLSSPRELDPRLLAWKGASVMSKLEIVNESWINSKEWEELGQQTQELLPRLLLSQLREVCRSLQLKVSGTKPTLVKRIQDHVRGLADSGDTGGLSRAQGYIDYCSSTVTKSPRMNSSSLPNQGSIINRIRLTSNNCYGDSNKETKSGGSDPSNRRSTFAPYNNSHRRTLPPSDTVPLSQNPHSTSISTKTSTPHSGYGSNSPLIPKLPSYLPSSYFHGILFKKSPFYEVIERVTPGKACQVSSDKSRVCIEFYFTQSLINKLTLKGGGLYQLRFFCCAAPDMQQINSRTAPLALVEFPTACELLVNGEQLQTSLRGIKNKPGTVQPPEITHLCHINLRSNNKLEFVYANISKPYIVMVQLVKKVNVHTIVEGIKKNKIISKAQVLQRLQKAAEDLDLVATSSVVSLKDPLCHLRINTPCRSIHCNHIQCFDLLYFFQMNEQTPTWTCPVCNNVLGSWEDIALDEYFSDILQQVPQDQESITIEANGDWVLTPPPPPPEHTEIFKKVDEKSSRNSSEPEIFVIEDSDEDDAKSVIFQYPPLEPKNQLKNKQEDIIDLTLDSDEDETPQKIQESVYQKSSPLNKLSHNEILANGESPLSFDLDILNPNNDWGAVTTPQTSTSLSSGPALVTPSSSPPGMSQYYYTPLGLMDINSLNAGLPSSPFYDSDASQNLGNTASQDNSNPIFFSNENTEPYYVNPNTHQLDHEDDTVPPSSLKRTINDSPYSPYFTPLRFLGKNPLLNNVNPDRYARIIYTSNPTSNTIDFVKRSYITEWAYSFFEKLLEQNRNAAVVRCVSIRRSSKILLLQEGEKFRYVSSSAGASSSNLAGLGSWSGSKKIKARVESVYSRGPSYKKTKLSGVSGSIVDLSDSLLLVGMQHGDGVKLQRSWESEVNSEEAGVSEVSDAENLESTVTEETSYMDPNASKTDEIEDDTTPKKIDDNTELVLPGAKFARSNYLLPVISRVLERHAFKLVKLFTLDVELLNVSGKTNSNKLISIKKIFYQMDGFGGASTPLKFFGIIRSFFTSEISLNKAKELVVNGKILVNDNLKKANICLNQEIIIKKILVDLPKSAVKSVFSKFDKIISIKMQLIGLWQKTLVEFDSLEIASLVAFMWSVSMSKDSVHVTLAVENKQTWCAVVCFKNKAAKLAVTGLVPVFRGVNLHWAGLSLACCAICKHFGHVGGNCLIGENSGNHRKRVVTDQNCVYLAGIYKKKLALVAQIAGGSSSHVVSSGFYGVDASSDAKVLLVDSFSCNVFGLNDYCYS